MRTRLVLAALMALFALAHQSQAAFIRGAGKDLEICLSGEVLETDGRPAADVEVKCGLNYNNIGSTKLQPTVDGHHFEVWIPVNRVRWYSMWLKASSKLNNHVAYHQLAAYRLRQAAIDRLSLKLQPPTREVKVSVIHDGQPVPGAKVKADVGYGIDLDARTNDLGIAQLHLLADQELSHLMAWTDDLRIGGFSFNRDPPRDPAANDHVIELSKCRNQTIRFVDENGTPVAGLPFVIQMATPPPNHNFIGTNENSHLKTDASGEAVYRWFPDWEEHFFYADLKTNDWIRDGDPETTGNVTVFKLKKGQPRKAITGQITSTTSLGGFLVEISSFQGEQKNHSDMRYGFTDLDGRFTVDLLPDAHYWVCAVDAQWVSTITDLVPYDSASDHVTPPQVEVSAGQEVEILVTVGPDKQPYPNLGINMHREHHFTWQEGNARRNGNGGPQWHVTTDQSGRATCRTLPGKLEARVYTPHWRAEESVTVRPGEPTTIELHRDNVEKRLVNGSVVLPPNSNQRLGDVVVQVGCVDGAYNDRQSANCDDDGQFSCNVFGSQLAIFATTPDGKLAGGVHIKDFEAPIEVELQPTIDFQGQLLGDGKPLIGQVVHAIVRIEGERGGRSAFARIFDVKHLETRTDEQGNYTFYSVPGDLQFLVYTDAIDGSGRTEYLTNGRFTAAQSPTRKVNKLQRSRNKEPDKPLADRFRSTLRDCAATGYQPIVIFYSGTARATEFANDQFVDHEKNADVYGFMQVVSNSTDVTPEDATFAKEHDFLLPQPGHVTVYAFDAQGQPTGNLDIDVSAGDAAVVAAAFVKEHAPKRVDAVEKWNEAFAEARRSHRRVLARVSQRYCGPCFMLARWLMEREEILAKDYVLLKIDNYRDEHGGDVGERLTRGNQHGIPFFAIFDEDEKMLIDSAGPMGNIGFPNTVEGKTHLRKMLLETRQNLSDAEVDTLVGNL